MEFRTALSLKKIPDEVQIKYTSSVVFLGSCFSDNIGEKCLYYKFNALVNPFGVLFHPMAIAQLVKRAVNVVPFQEDELISKDQHYYAFEVHSSFSDTNKQRLIQRLNETLNAVREFLIKASHVVITLGTAWVYEHIASNRVVANCHKIPQKAFSKRLLSIQEIVASLNEIHKSILSVNQHVQMVFTVSPVRHLKDGFIENQRSKSHLIAAVHEMVSKAHQNTRYFPSYELMLDDLRDYRFYEPDMIHPNAIAIAYIWEGFKQCYINKAAHPTMSEVEAIQKGLAHKPFNPDSEAHKQFLLSLKQKIRNLEMQIPEIRF